MIADYAGIQSSDL